MSVVCDKGNEELREGEDSPKIVKEIRGIEGKTSNESDSQTILLYWANELHRNSKQ